MHIGFTGFTGLARPHGPVGPSAAWPQGPVGPSAARPQGPVGPSAAHAPHAGSAENARKVGFPSFEHRRARRSSLCVQRDAQNSISRDYFCQHTTGRSKGTPDPRPTPRTFGLRNPEPQEEHRLTPARSFASPARTHDTKRNNFPVELTRQPPIYIYI